MSKLFVHQSKDMHVQTAVLLDGATHFAKKNVEKITTLTRNTGKIANLSNITQLLKMETAKYVSCNFNT